MRAAAARARLKARTHSRRRPSPALRCPAQAAARRLVMIAGLRQCGEGPLRASLTGHSHESSHGASRYSVVGGTDRAGLRARARRIAPARRFGQGSGSLLSGAADAADARRAPAGPGAWPQARGRLGRALSHRGSGGPAGFRRRGRRTCVHGGANRRISHRIPGRGGANRLCRRPAVGPLLDQAARLAESRSRHHIRLWLSVAIPARWRGEIVRRGRRAFRTRDGRQDPARRRAGWRGQECSRANAPLLGLAQVAVADPDRQGPPSRGSFARFVNLATRWSDNDAYGHLNNVVYYALFDSAVNAVLIEAGRLDPASSEVIGLVVESSCRYYASLTYPEPAEVGVAVEHLGRSSVRYHLAVFKAGVTEAAAAGRYTHVYVERATNRPVLIPEAHRRLMEGLKAL